MIAERVSTHYVLRYVYAILVIVVIASATVLSTLYVAQQDERQTHERIQFYHLESVSESNEIRREVDLLRGLVQQGLAVSEFAGTGLAGVSEVLVSPVGIVQSIQSRIDGLSALQQQYREPVFADVLERMSHRLQSVAGQLQQEAGPTQATLTEIGVLRLAVEQFDRLHKIEARLELEALAVRQGDRPRFLAVLIACLAFSGVAGGYIVYSLKRSMDRQYEVEAALVDSQERLHHIQKLDALGRLVGGVAHDFNNLLTVILGHIEILRLASAKDDALDQGLTEIQRAGQQAATLTQQLLAFSRRQQLQPRVVDLNRQLADMESLLRRIVSEDIKLRFTYAPDRCPIEVDPDQLRQVIMNLIANARDAMPDGGELRITTDCIAIGGGGAQVVDLPDGRYGRLIVADTGTGMEEETLQRIFEPFFTTKDETRGTGLGLSTAHGVVTGSGGHIRVDSTVGQGTKFYIYFPCTEKGMDSEPEGGTNDAPRPGTETILIVEDDENVLKFVKTGLVSLGYTVETALSGAAGLEICKRAPGAIDVILSDIVMPEMDGPAFMKQALELCPEAIPMFMSAYTRDEALRAGNDHDTDIPLLNKPFRLDELARRLRDLLDAKASTQGAAAE